MKTTIYIIHTAQFYNNPGELITYAKAFTSLEKAAKFVVKDYNYQCKLYDDPNTLSKTAWKGLSKTRTIESPADLWSDAWIKWEITSQRITV